MKRIIIAILIAMLMIPALATAQETPIPPAQWTVSPARSIIWIGEDLIVMVNGTGNTSYAIEMRPLDANMTVGNATYTDYRKTDLNGTDWAVIPDGYNEEPGSYRVQVLINQMVVGYADVRVDYSFERWVEIQFKKQETWNANQNATNQAEVVERRAMYDLIVDAIKQNNFQWGVILGMVMASIPIWFGAYKDRCETKRKRSRFIEILEGVEEDRRIYYGGTVTGAKPPRMYGGVNSCADKSDKDHNGETCPHCALDQWAQEMGLQNMTHEQIIEYIGGGKRVDAVKVQKPGMFKRAALWREYKKSKKVDNKKVK